MLRFQPAILILAVTGGLALSAGCPQRAAPPPLAVPTGLLSVRYFYGTALSGAQPGPVSTTDPTTWPGTQPTTGPTTPTTTEPTTDQTTVPTTVPASGPSTRPAAAPDGPLAVTVTWTALENVPVTSYPPVGSRAVFFSSTGGGDAVLPAAELTRDATIVDLQSPAPFLAAINHSSTGRVREFGSLAGSLPAGVTGDFAAMDPSPVLDPVTGAATRRGFDIMVSRPADGVSPVQLALVVRDMVTPKHGSPGIVTETAVFDLPAGDVTQTGLVIPFKFGAGETRAVAVVVSIGKGTDDKSHAIATAECLRQLAANTATTQPTGATGQADPWSTVTAAVQGLTAMSGRRSSLVFLADQTHAPLCADLAMEADDDVLAKLVADIRNNLPAKTPTTGPAAQPDPDVGWFLDQTALRLLVKLSDDDSNGKYKMPGELTAILTVHAGEVGRHASALDDLLRGLVSRSELDNRLTAGNTIFLEDSSPASRVRAFDWLDARHLAPAGYDPLAPAKARRAALARAAGVQ